MDLKELRKSGLILLECVSGSRAQGLATASSDTDIKGVYVYPQSALYGLNYLPQINNATNDEVFYELGRFVELLSVNNPNILELLYSPADTILQRHPIMDMLDPRLFLSKRCKDSFGNFALSQIRKAKGLNKKVLNPMDRRRKTVLEFCFVNRDGGSQPLMEFLREKNWEQEKVGLVNIPHMENLYGLYYGDNYKGVIHSENSNEVLLSSIPKGAKQEALLYFNKNGYSTYCKDYREYWQWVEKRNDTRYQNTLKHGKNYDAKNMMHTFRLLQMAEEIALEGTVNVRRADREFLLHIKSGELEYDALLQMAQDKMSSLQAAYASADLPDQPDLHKINLLLSEMRTELYRDPAFQ